MAAFKITYTTLSADDPQINAAFDEAVKRIEALKGQDFPMLINGKEVKSDQTFPVISPIDAREPFMHFQEAKSEHVDRAVAAAKAAYPAWAATPYEERCALVDKVGDMISENLMDLSAAIIMEMGKNRVEAMGEVEESADLLRYYAYQMRENDGYKRVMNSFGDTDKNVSRLKPYGVWAVISPFNFPLALAAGPVGAALVAGNTVVLKPSEDSLWTCYKLIEYFIEAGVPDGVVNLVTGKGETVGHALVHHPDVDGITFTGSYEVGFNEVYRSFATTFPKPVVVEMGGKNPAIISNKADLDIAATGVLRSAYGMSGQKCSACSRTYVHEDVYDDFIDLLVEKTRAINLGDPLNKETFLGPVVHKKAYENFKAYAEKAKKDGSIVYGGHVVTDGELANGYYVEPTIIADLDHDHDLVQQELFVPILFVKPVKSLEQAMEEANDVRYGLTAGFYSKDDSEVEWFLDNIEAGVVYVNRMAGATTGAWPGYQPFGGWKSSGSSGRNIGGYWSLLSYMREQSQTVFPG